MPKVTRLGELIRLYRVMHGLSVRDLAKEVGIHYATISRFERTDTEVTATTFVKLLVWLLNNGGTS